MKKPVIQLSVLLLSAMVALQWARPVQAACPAGCDCRWRGGKQTVECRNLMLKTLPSDIEPMTQVLDMSGNNLQTVGREALARANLINLQKIYLANCRIGFVDDTALRGLTNLVELDLSDNMLTSVPSPTLAEAPSLRELRLAGNPIDRIDDDAFGQVTGLVKLDLTGCRIATLSARSLNGLSQLWHLRLGANQLTHLDKAVIDSLPKLHGIELADNPWTCDCRLRPMRQWLHQSNVATASRSAAVCQTPPRLHQRLVMQVPLDELACAPRVIPGVQDGAATVRVADGDNATLSCRIGAEPEAQINWLYRGRPLVNTTSTGADRYALPPPPDATPSSAESLSSSSADLQDNRRSVIIVHQGVSDKTSYLILSPAGESDAGDYVCVAANAAGLVQTNVTLRVDARRSLIGSLTPAHVAALGAGLLVLVAVCVALVLVVLTRCQSSSSSAAPSPLSPLSTSKHAMQHQQQRQVVVVNGDGSKPATSTSVMMMMTAASPSAFEYGHVASAAYDNSALAYNSRPDLIDQYWQQQQQQQQQYSPGTGDYRSAHNDSLYPSALWTYSAQDDVINLPHVAVVRPSTQLDAQQLQQHQQQQQQQQDSQAETMSMDSYCLPQPIPQQQQQVPYPADYGLPLPPDGPPYAPKSATSGRHLFAATATATTAATTAVAAAAGSPPTATSTLLRSPSLVGGGGGGGSTMGRPSAYAYHHHQHTMNKRSYARDSPDEGYQEESATDV